MFEAATTEFPFVEALPKREQSKVAEAIDLVRQIRDATERCGVLVPVMLAAKYLHVSRTRIDQMVTDGRLRRVAVDGHVFITEDSLVELAKLERERGKPLKVPRTVREAWRLAREYAAESRTERK